jgi:hypothetical protein
MTTGVILDPGESPQRTKVLNPVLKKKDLYLFARNFEQLREL